MLYMKLNYKQSNFACLFIWMREVGRSYATLVEQTWNTRFRVDSSKCANTFDAKEFLSSWKYIHKWRWLQAKTIYPKMNKKRTDNKFLWSTKPIRTCWIIYKKTSELNEHHAKWTDEMIQSCMNAMFMPNGKAARNTYSRNQNESL